MPQQATAVMAPAATGSRRRVDHWFYISVGLAMILFNVVAFGPSIVDSSGRLGPLTPVVAAHGMVSSAFLLLFLMQGTLVATGLTTVHRRLGIVGALLAAAMIVVGYIVSIEWARRGYDISGDLQRFGAGQPPATLGENLAVGISLFGAFGIVVGAAIWYRRRPDIHKRLMLLAMVGVLTGPPFAHLMGHWPVLTAVASVVQLPITILLLSVSAIHDRVTEGRIHPVSLWGALLLFAWFPVWIAVIGPSRTWNEFASWLIQ